MILSLFCLPTGTICMGCLPGRSTPISGHTGDTLIESILVHVLLYSLGMGLFLTIDGAVFSLWMGQFYKSVAIHTCTNEVKVPPPPLKARLYTYGGLAVFLS